MLLSSHVLAEVEELSDTVTNIRGGRTVDSGSLAELRHLTRSTVTAVTDRDPAPLTALPGVHAPTVDGDRVTFLVDDTQLDGVVRALAGLGVRALTVAPPSLEELVLRHYGAGSGGGDLAPAGAGAPR